MNFNDMIGHSPRITIRAPALTAVLLPAAALWMASSILALDPGKPPPQPPPQPPPASNYAPADDLIGQVEFYLKRSDESLASNDAFDEAAQSRLKKDANTLAALALVLGMHDGENPMKLSAGALVGAAQKMAAATDYSAAKEAFDSAKKAASGESSGTDDKPLKWMKVASLDQLMKQVPAINAALKRSITPQRFDPMKTQSAGQSAALAAIAQSVMADMQAVKNPADAPKWYQFCGEMRDAAGGVNSAIHAGDQAALATAMSRLAKSCESCHAVFR
jgi:hypothetical protein